jgi:nicotinate-nucleotide--dimethylbenzimidazole phosphoribosyltransferase
MDGAGEQALARLLQARVDSRTKPLGSLGALESLAVRLGLALGSATPRLRNPHLLVFAADHGIAAAGASAYPPEVTRQMLRNYAQGGAAINVLARQHGIALTVVDAGVRRAVPDVADAAGAASVTPAGARLLERRIGDGTQDFRFMPAMQAAQREAAILAGRELAAECLRSDANALLLGEMGIGNTASAALLLHRLTGWALADCVGRGSGLDDPGLERKRALLAAAASRCPAALGPLELLEQFGGFEIAMLVGALLEAASRPCVVVVDGFTVTVAVLLASRVDPRIGDRCVYSHCSAESAHRRLLDLLGARPLLDLGLRLGEGSGAALAWPLVESSARLLVDMASFESAAVSTRVG